VGSYQYAGALAHGPNKIAGQNCVYDANGNLTSGGGRTYVWDYDNRLASTTVGGATSTFVYNAEGGRVRKTEGGAITRYFGEYVARNGSQRVQYVYAGPMMVARKDAAGARWHHADHLDSVRLITNAAGQVVKKYDYSAYGAVVNATGTAVNERGFNGHAFDELSGLVYMKARYYDPELGRFISPDTLVPDPKNPQALNRFAYAYNNPVTNADPTGHAPVAAAVLSAVIVTAKTTSTLVAVTAWVGAGLSVAGYYSKDPLLSSIGSVLLGFAGGYVSSAPLSPVAKGLVGAGVGAAQSPLSPLDPGVKEAIGWAFDAYGVVDGPDTAVQFVFHKGANVAARMGVSKAAEELGVDPGELNVALTIVSFAGNKVAGSRLRERHEEGYVGILGVTGRTHSKLGLIFDGVDIVLGYQGLPSATAYEYMFSANRDLPLIGHSLGALDVNNLAGLQIAGKSVISASLPAFNAGAPGVQVVNGAGDIINGFGVFGRVFSPFGQIISVPFITGHGAGYYYPHVPNHFYDP